MSHYVAGFENDIVFTTRAGETLYANCEMTDGEYWTIWNTDGEEIVWY